MNPSMLRPSTVTVPDNSGVGLGGRTALQQNAMNGAPQSGLSHIQNLLNKGLSQTVGQPGAGGGFNWGNSGGGMYEDEGLRALKASSTVDTDSLEYHAERAAKAVETFIIMIFHRNGQIYEAYKKAKESFKLNGVQQPCAIRTAFIEDVEKVPEFTRVIAMAGAPFFGWMVVDTYRTENRDNITPNEYLQFAFNACRNVLMFEMINWLMKSKNGQRFANRLTPELTERVKALPNFKELGLRCFELFKASFPYAALEFKIPEFTRPDYSMLIQEMALSGAVITDPAAINYKPISDEQRRMQATNATEELMSFVSRAASRGVSIKEPEYSHYNLDGHQSMNWNVARTDFENMTKANMSEFNLHSHFLNIGAENQYFVDEEVWRKVKKKFRKHPDMGREESVLEGCFRIVTIDLNKDDGWFSTIVRSNRLTMATVLTDPKSLLPLIQDSSNENTWKATFLDMDTVVKPGSIQVNVEECHKLSGKGIPVIAFKDVVSGNKNDEVKGHLELINRTLTEKFKGSENAVSFETVVWDVYTCESPEELIRIRDDLPCLFKDANIDEEKSFYQVCREVASYASQGIVSDSLIKFIDGHLTSMVNNWLINACGYGGGYDLSVGSIIADFRELSSYLKEKDPEVNSWLHNVVEPHFLKENAKIFTHDNKYNKSDDDSFATTLKQRVELNVVRPLMITMVNNRVGPYPEAENIPVVIKRSKFPEYFKMVEDGFKAAMKNYTEAESVDKIITFTKTNTSWLFTYSNLDKNTATLRRIGTNGPLVLLPLQ